MANEKPGRHALTTIRRFVRSNRRTSKMVGLAGVEPATHGLGNRCSIHLSYRPAKTFYNKGDDTAFVTPTVPSQAKNASIQRYPMPILELAKNYEAASRFVRTACRALGSCQARRGSREKWGRSVGFRALHMGMPPYETQLASWDAACCAPMRAWESAIDSLEISDGAALDGVARLELKFSRPSQLDFKT